MYDVVGLEIAEKRAGRIVEVSLCHGLPLCLPEEHISESQMVVWKFPYSATLQAALPGEPSHSMLEMSGRVLSCRGLLW